MTPSDEVFGPPATTGRQVYADRLCKTCQVAWHHDSGTSCWMCGAQGILRNVSVMGAPTVYVEDPPTWWITREAANQAARDVA